MKAYEALARAFVEEGTTYVFGVMGDATQHWVNALARLGVPLYEARHEAPALTMAAVKGALTGEPGVVTTTNGPGVTQLATTMVVASRSSIPLVAFCGDTPWGDEDASHRFDHARFAAAIECGFVRLTSPDKAYEAVQKAFYLARLESRPIMLSAPIDAQMGNFEDDLDEYVPSKELLTNKAVYPNPEPLRQAAKIVAKSERPVIVVGRGAILADAGDAVQSFANRIGALVTTSVMAMNWPTNPDDYHVGISGLFSTRAAIELFQESDCVIAVGASMNSYTTEHGYLFPDASVIQIDRKPQVVLGDGRSADVYLQSDARVGLDALDRLLGEQSVHRTGYRTSEVKERLQSALDDPTVYALEPGTMDPREVCRVLDEAIPNDMGFVVAGSHASQMATMLIRGKRPYTLINKYFGSMGKGIGQVVGACIANDKRPTAVVEGDVGFMMHLAEFETAVRYDLPVFVVIMNDQAMGAELRHAETHPDILDPDLARIPTPDLGLVGVALGGRGRLVRTAHELRAAASEFLKNPGPMLVDARISSNVESIQIRRRFRGQEDI